MANNVKVNITKVIKEKYDRDGKLVAKREEENKEGLKPQDVNIYEK